MPLLEGDLRRLPAELYGAELDAVPEELLRARCPGLGVADAYAIQMEGVHLRLADGDRVRGHKVDLTARVMQQQFGVAQPDFGRLLASMIDLQGEPLPVDRLIEPEVEPEVAFMLARERPGGRWPTYWRRRAMRRCLRHEHHR